MRMNNVSRETTKNNPLEQNTAARTSDMHTCATALTKQCGYRRNEGQEHNEETNKCHGSRRLM